MAEWWQRAALMPLAEAVSGHLHLPAWAINSAGGFVQGFTAVPLDWLRLDLAVVSPASRTARQRQMLQDVQAILLAAATSFPALVHEALMSHGESMRAILQLALALGAGTLAYGMGHRLAASVGRRNLLRWIPTSPSLYAAVPPLAFALVVAVAGLTRPGTVLEEITLLAVGSLAGLAGFACGDAVVATLAPRSPAVAVAQANVVACLLCVLLLTIVRGWQDSAASTLLMAERAIWSFVGCVSAYAGACQEGALAFRRGPGAFLQWFGFYASLGGLVILLLSPSLDQFLLASLALLPGT